jgi:hypothetical protein
MMQFAILDVDMNNLVDDGPKTDGEGKIGLDGNAVATMRQTMMANG